MPSKDFLALNPGYSAADMPGANRRRTKRHAPGLERPDRAKPGEGDRVPDLMRLAAVGYTCTNYLHETGEYWMSGAAGESPRAATYREALDSAMRERGLK